MSFSAASSSSFGSGIGSEDENQRIEAADEEEEELDSSWEAGIHGLAYAEKSSSWVFAGARLLLDWMQVILLLVSPVWGWQIDEDNSWWRAFAFIGLPGLRYSASVRGYSFFLIFMYVLSVLQLAVLGLCVWVASGFRKGQFEHLWPIAIIRGWNRVFVQTLPVTLLLVFLLPWDCAWFSSPYASPPLNMVALPDVQCLAMPHMIHMAVSMISALLSVAISALFTLGDVETSPLELHPMATAHTRSDVIALCIKVSMCFVAIFLTSLQWMTVFQFILTTLLVCVYLRWVPYQQIVVTCIRAGSVMSVFYTSLLFLVMAYEPGVDPEQPSTLKALQVNVTTALWGGCFPLAMVGAALAYWRTRYLTQVVPEKFENAPSGTKPRRIHKFWDTLEVEVASRCMRVWVDELCDVLDESAANLAHQILRAGVVLFPRDAYAAILSAAFQTNVVGNYQAGRLEMKAAKRMPSVGIIERYFLYVLDQQTTAKSISSASGGEGDSLDLQTYVEYQRTFKLTVMRHVEALTAQRVFWQTLMHRNVTFAKVARAIADIESTTRVAERQYKQALSRHSTSTDLLTLYVKFLSDARFDPWSASTWAAEVEKLQRQEEEENNRVLLGQQELGKSAADKMSTHHNTKAVIVMGANCIIRMANDRAATALGFASKTELVGRNVNIIVPPPFSQNHNQYVRNYIETGEGQVINRTREFVALHRDGYVVPVMVHISKVSGIGEDSVFMAAFDVLPTEPDVARVWVLSSGCVLSCDQAFTDWFGYRHEDLQQEEMAALVSDPIALNNLFYRMQTESTNDVARKGALAGSSVAPTPTEWPLEGVCIKHLYRDRALSVEMSVSQGGVGSTSLFRIKLRLREPVGPSLLCVDSKGRIVHLSSSLASTLGRSVQELQASRSLHALDALLPLPFARLHHLYCRHLPEEPGPYSCVAGLTVPLAAVKPGVGACYIPYQMRMKRREVTGRDPITVATMEQRTMEEMMSERRVSMVVDDSGVVKSVTAASPSLFGFEMQALVGTHLSYIIDVLQLNQGMTASKGSGPHLGSHEQLSAAADLIRTMAHKTYECNGNMSWRVGVTPVLDPDVLLGLGPIGVAMMGKRVVPAVMCVEPYMEDPPVNGAAYVLPDGMLYKVSLWRSDALTGVLEVDPAGYVESVGVKGLEAFNPSFLLGLPTHMLLGAHISTLIPCGRAHIESLFTEGSMQPNVRRGGPRAGGARGGLRQGMVGGARKLPGPRHLVHVNHGTDGEPLELEVQAVVRQTLGASSSLYVVMRAAAPRPGRTDFAYWLKQQGPPRLPVEPETDTHASVGLNHNHSVDAHPHGLPRTGSALAGGRADEEGAVPRKKGQGIHWGGDAQTDSTPPGARSRVSPVHADTAPAILQQQDQGDEVTREDGNGSGNDSGAEDSAAPGTEAQSEAGGDDVEDDGSDPASRALAELKRGKRVKRLTRMLMAPNAQTPHNVLARASVIAVLLLIAVDVAMFVVFKTLLQAQTDQVLDLRSTSKAINRLMACAIQTTSLGILLSGSGDPSVLHLGAGRGDSPYAITPANLQYDINFALNTLEVRLADLELFHKGVFRGFDGRIQPMTSSYGLRDLWEEPSLSMRVFYSTPAGVIVNMTSMSLWDAGNEIVLRVRSILQNWKATYGVGTNNSAAFVNSTDALFILYNAQRDMTGAYEKTLDGLMRKAVDDSAALNNIQLIILGVEGVAVALITAMVIFIIASRSVGLRYKVLSIFMAVPGGVVRTLATAPLDVGTGSAQDQEDDVDQEDREALQALHEDTYNTQGGGMGGKPTVRQQYKMKMAEEAALKVRLMQQQTNTDDEPRTFLSRLMFWRSNKSNDTSVLLSKRSLQQSPWATLYWVWPFLLWPLLVILLNMQGYLSLQNVAQPIAISNIVQFMSIRTFRTRLFAQRYAARLYFNSDFTGILPGSAFPPGAYNPLSKPVLDYLAEELPKIKTEYNAMLYGATAPGLENTMDPHFTLATKGIVFMPGAELLYTATNCMSQQNTPGYPADCFTPTHPFYKLTTTGLDQAFKEYFSSLNQLVIANYSDVSLSNPAFKYIWEVGGGHLTGGLVALTDVFTNGVTSVYQSALTMHIVALALCVSLGIMFILFVQRPASRAVIAESRRVAQLFSCLPSEIDVEGFLASTLMTQDGSAAPAVAKDALSGALDGHKSTTGASAHYASKKVK